MVTIFLHALAWFRAADLDEVEQTTGSEWDVFVEPLPSLYFPKPTYAVSLRRSALAAALHADAFWGAIASGFDRGLSAYCWPRDAIWVAGTLARLGHPSIGRGVYQWLSRVRGQNRSYAYWFQKYTIDGGPEWETPAVDQSAVTGRVVQAKAGSASPSRSFWSASRAWRLRNASSPVRT